MTLEVSHCIGVLAEIHELLDPPMPVFELHFLLLGVSWSSFLLAPCLGRCSLFLACQGEFPGSLRVVGRQHAHEQLVMSRVVALPLFSPTVAGGFGEHALYSRKLDPAVSIFPLASRPAETVYGRFYSLRKILREKNWDVAYELHVYAISFID